MAAMQSNASRRDHETIQPLDYCWSPFIIAGYTEYAIARRFGRVGLHMIHGSPTFVLRGQTSCLEAELRSPVGTRQKASHLNHDSGILKIVLKRTIPTAISILILLTVAIFFCRALPVSAQQPVVVELFTSEGCSSCPPPDALLTELSRQHVTGSAELVALGEHVEYWNSPAWTDRFSSSVFTERQNEYVHQLHLAAAYTPQIVIDGHLQTVGNDTSAVRR